MATSKFFSFRAHEFENVHGMDFTNRTSSPQDLYTMTLALGATEATTVAQRPRYKTHTALQESARVTTLLSST